MKKSETRRNREADWEPEDGHHVTVTEHCISMQINHFTLFKTVGRATGRKKAKLIQLVATSSDLKADEFLDITVHAVNEYSHSEVHSNIFNSIL